MKQNELDPWEEYIELLGKAFLDMGLLKDTEDLNSQLDKAAEDIEDLRKEFECETIG